MRGLADIANLLETHAELRRLLGLVESLALPDGWIGAGVIRNAVWDVLHGRAISLDARSDVDVVFFDPADIRPERDEALERRLLDLDPHVAWSVRNQVRMHRRNGDRPYRDTFDAVSHWPETATAVAARLVRNRVEVIAPHGIDDLLGLIVRPTPTFRHKMEIYRQRLAAKNWASRWPKLKTYGADGIALAIQ